MIGSIIAWIIIGLVAGALAKLIMPGDDPGGIIVTILIGIAGAFVGGFLASLIGLAEGASGPLSEEEVRVEGEPLAEDETAELKPGEDETRSGEER